MRILIIRHGDPDYSVDGLTERGRHEAELLAEKLKKEPIEAIWCSTMGRAMQTCEPTARALGMTPIYRDWLREVPFPIRFETYPERGYWFSHPPRAWAELPGIDHVEDWKKLPMFACTDIAAYTDNVFRQFDALLSSYGYVRHGRWFELLPGRKDTVLALFCHQGLGTALISHICGLPLPMLWNHSMTPTSSVTTVIMDRFRADDPIAVARVLSMGDTGHLYAAGEKVNFRGLHHEITP
ncbi:MAG: histidine phosphatase family protein [Firmicutes bacterium]|nr:histidine phosphatase family protein [Bacillota bacterium]